MSVHYHPTSEQSTSYITDAGKATNHILINTKPPHEHQQDLRIQANAGMIALQNVGATVLITGGHHRKVAVLDRRVIYEGSLNILSQNDSCEIMRRIESSALATDMIQFLKVTRFTNS